MLTDVYPRLGKNRILFLAANPIDTVPLRLDKEYKLIDSQIQVGKYRDEYEMIQVNAVSVKELQDNLLRFRPAIVHFSGHGSSAGALVFEDEDRVSDEVSPRALAELFEIINHDDNTIRLVFLGACYSEKQARAIAKHVDCVVGMKKEVTDEAAIAFAGSFYLALSQGESVEKAFKLARNQLRLQDIAEDKKPKLTSKPGIDASTIKLVAPQQNEDKREREKWTKWGAIGAIAAAVIAGVALIPPPQELDFTFKPPNVDAGSPTQFPITAFGGSKPYTYSWDFGDNSKRVAKDSETTPHRYLSPGDYIVTISVADSSGKNITREYEVHVSAMNPILSVSLPEKVTWTVNDTHMLSAEINGGSNRYDYTWDFGDNSTVSHSRNPEHSYVMAGEYVVSIDVVDSEGNRGHDEMLVIVTYPIITIDFSWKPVKPDPNSEVLFEASVSGGFPGYSYSWDFGDNSTISAMEAPNHTFMGGPDITRYKVTLTVSDSNNVNETVSKFVTVNAGRIDIMIENFGSEQAVARCPSDFSAICVFDECGWGSYPPCTYGYITGSVKATGNIPSTSCEVSVHVSRNATGLPLLPSDQLHIEYYEQTELSTINPDSTIPFSIKTDFDHTGRYKFTGTAICSEDTSDSVTSELYVDLDNNQ